jgi:hypothetical protein
MKFSGITQRRSKNVNSLADRRPWRLGSLETIRNGVTHLVQGGGLCTIREMGGNVGRNEQMRRCAYEIYLETKIWMCYLSSNCPRRPTKGQTPIDRLIILITGEIGLYANQLFPIS